MLCITSIRSNRKCNYIARSSVKYQWHNFNSIWSNNRCQKYIHASNRSCSSHHVSPLVCLFTLCPALMCISSSEGICPFSQSASLERYPRPEHTSASAHRRYRPSQSRLRLPPISTASPAPHHHG